jgi:hypothetical protein
MEGTVIKVSPRFPKSSARYRFSPNREKVRNNPAVPQSPAGSRAAA